MERKKKGQNHQKKKEIVPIAIKEGGNASSQQMTRQQIGTKTQKPYKMQVQKILRKVDGWVVDKFHNISEQIVGLHLL